MTLSPFSDADRDAVIQQYHTYNAGQNQTTNVHIKRIRAPIDKVWSFVRQFDNPMCYKPYVRSCETQGEVAVGSIRHVTIVTGIPAESSIEKLLILDDENYRFGYEVIGGNHHLQNYRSLTTLHQDTINGYPATLLIESYVVDIPQQNTARETEIFVKTIIDNNHRNLAMMAE